MRYLSKEDRSRRIERHFGVVQAVRVEKVERPTVPEIADASLKLLITFAMHLGILLVDAYGSIGLHPSEGKRALDDLIARGFIRLHRLTRRGRGGQPTTAEVLPLGITELAKRGITRTEKKLKRGGFKHDVYARYVEAWAKLKGHQYWFERTLGQKAFDFVYQDASGILRAIEICLSGSVEWNAKQAIKGAEVAGIAQVILASERKGFIDAILDEVREFDALGLYRPKIVGKLLAEFMP